MLGRRLLHPPGPLIAVEDRDRGILGVAESLEPAPREAEHAPWLERQQGRDEVFLAGIRRVFEQCRAEPSILSRTDRFIDHEHKRGLPDFRWTIDRGGLPHSRNDQGQGPVFAVAPRPIDTLGRDVVHAKSQMPLDTNFGQAG